MNKHKKNNPYTLASLFGVILIQFIIIIVQNNTLSNQFEYNTWLSERNDVERMQYQENLEHLHSIIQTYEKEWLNGE